jgi:uncharacterized protein YceH (UPF0502 family)
VVELAPEQQRVLGCLIEKQAFTPDAYPLTLNGLVAACNQTSNRDPLVAYDEATIVAALDGLREQGLVRVVHSSSYRATKYRHVADEAWALTSGELAVLAVLLLRGPQTLNELRTRTERYGSDIDDLGGVEEVLRRLAQLKEEPFVVHLGRQSGQREDRWTHLLGSPPPASEGPSGGSAPTFFPTATLPREVVNEAASGGLSVEVARLRSEVEALRDAVADLRRELGLSDVE